MKQLLIILLIKFNAWKNIFNNIIIKMRLERSWHICGDLIPEFFSIKTLLLFQGVFGALFIKANLFWCKLRRSTILGTKPILEVWFYIFFKFILYDFSFELLISVSYLNSF